MAKATTKANEVVDEKVTGQAEEVLPEVTESTNAEALPSEATSDSAKKEEKAVDKKDDRVEVVLPRFIFTQDTESTHHEVCANGKIYQLQYDVPVMVPPMVAEIVKNAIEQRKKAKELVKSLSGKAQEISL